MRKSPKTKAEPKPLTVAAAVGEIAAAVREWLSAFKPRVKPKLSVFMNEHARDDTGKRIYPFPFQADMADATVDPETAQVTCRKSSRIGWSTIMQCRVAWSIRYDPRRTLIYQPTIDDAEKFSRDDLDPVLQWKVVRDVATFKPRHADNQIRAKRYKGGWIQIKGANSAKEFRRVTADDVFLEECDGYLLGAYSNVNLGYNNELGELLGDGELLLGLADPAQGALFNGWKASASLGGGGTYVPVDNRLMGVSRQIVPYDVFGTLRDTNLATAARGPVEHA